MKRIMIPLTLLASVAAAFTLTSTARAQPIAPEWVEIAGLSAFGSGCPPGSYSALLSPDYLALTIKFGDFDAQLDPTVFPPINNPNEFCTLSVLLDFPGGWSYSLIDATYRGRVDLGVGTKGQQTSEYWFQGVPGSPSFSSSFLGPFFGPYERKDDLEVAAWVWSPCGVKRYLNIDADVSVSNAMNPAAKAYMNLKTAEIAVEATYGITWRLCD